MRVLVTGHRGYVGTALVPLLQEAGHEVAGLDSGLFAGCAWRPPAPVRGIEKDIRDAAPADLDGADAVIHLAALCNDPLGELDPALTHRINCEAAVRLATLARQAGVARFLYASSCSVYGAAGDDWLDEDSALSPVTAYAVSKLRAEQAIAALEDDGFSPTFLRAGTAYGVSPMIRFDLVLNNLAAWAGATGMVRLKSDGSAWRPLVHVEDIARAYHAVLEAPRDAVAGRAFNVGRTEENYRVRDLARIVARAFPDSRVEMAGGASADVRCYRVACDRIAEAVPAFRPLWTAEAGARQLAEALGAGQVTVETFEGARYQRLAHLRKLIDAGSVDGSLRWRQAAMATA